MILIPPKQVAKILASRKTLVYQQIKTQAYLTYSFSSEIACLLSSFNLQHVTREQLLAD